jgi:hypothetical protein
MYPTFTLDFPTDPSEIIVKSAPKDGEEEKKQSQLDGNAE